METDDPAQLDRVMARLADGDLAYVVTLAEGWRGPLARLVRALLLAMGRRDLAANRDEVAGLVLDACFVIADRAGGWRRGGAPPWVWARCAIRAEVARSIGHRCVELDDRFHDEGEPAPVDTVDYDELVERDPRFASFDDVLRQCTSERDRRIVIEYVQQRAAGDPSPAHTVGPMFDLEPATVRQVHSRAMRKIRRLLGDEPPSSEGSRAA
ncbi:MAG: hypothetical protein ABI658_17380 [Acidimicrobiales bacterium]